VNGVVLKRIAPCSDDFEHELDISVIGKLKSLEDAEQAAARVADLALEQPYKLKVGATVAEHPRDVGITEVVATGKLKPGALELLGKIL
jgi:hypothetical protein